MVNNYLNQTKCQSPGINHRLNIASLVNLTWIMIVNITTMVLSILAVWQYHSSTFFKIRTSKEWGSSGCRSSVCWMYLMQSLNYNWLLQVMWHKNDWNTDLSRVFPLAESRWHHSTVSRQNASTSLVTSVNVSIALT